MDAEDPDRYIYIPLGGTRNVLASSVLIFTFVALWHDLSFRLLAWGWLVSLFLVPELIARAVLPRSKVTDFCHLWAYVLTLPHRSVRRAAVVPARMRGWGSAQCPHDVGGQPRWVRDWDGRYIVHGWPTDRQLGRCAWQLRSDTMRAISVAELDLVHRTSIHSFYVFLSICWRTDHVRVQVCSVPTTPHYGYTQTFTFLGRKSCVLGL